MKIHMLKIEETSTPSKRRTYCGLIGWFTDNSDTELVTVYGNRFEISRRYKEVTCKKCRGVK